VSDEGAGKIEPYIKQHDIKYGVVYAQNVLTTYGGRGYPSAWAVGPDGKVIWGGHPASVTEEMVEGWVKDLAPTKVDKELAKELKGAVKAFDSGEYGKALTEANKAAETAEDELVKTDAKYLTDLVQKHIDLYTAKMTKARESGDLVKLGKALGEASAKFKDSEQGEKWAGELKELEKSDEYKETVKASDELEKLRPKLEDMKPSSAKKALEKIAKKYPETTAGKEAAELAKRYEE
jgi:hypothetical protein